MSKKEHTIDRNYIYTLLIITALLFAFILYLSGVRNTGESLTIDYDLGKYQERLTLLEDSVYTLRKIVEDNREICLNVPNLTEDYTKRLDDISELLEGTNDSFSKILYKVDFLTEKLDKGEK